MEANLLDEARSIQYQQANSIPREFPLANPSIVLHILTSSNFDPQDLARLEATSSFFKQPANLEPDYSLSLSELAAFDMCFKRVIFKEMMEEEKQLLKQRCGGSWKLVLKYLMAYESTTRRGKSQVIAGPGHSIAVTSGGAVYTFGDNSSGQLGLGTWENQARPQLIRSLQGIRIVQAVAAEGKTMLVSETGRVYAFGKDGFGEQTGSRNPVSKPQLVESLKDVFVVQAAIGYFFAAVLSREGRVYTFSWGTNERLGHRSDPRDREPRPLLGPLANLPVVQIAAGHCYLAALAFQPNGMSVYTVGCGLGGKLAHGSITNEKYPRLVEFFKILNLKPVCLVGGTWHAAIVGRDGRVCTWGWGHYGCLGNGTEDYEPLPMVVRGLNHIKAVHVAVGDCTTFVVSRTGNVYSFGYGGSSNLGHAPFQQTFLQIIPTPPMLGTLLKEITERIVQISPTNSSNWTNDAHTLVLTESGKLYAFGSGAKGQLGIEFSGHLSTKPRPERVQIDLS